jgi:2-keto-3-deoxy-L-rhamnonate aldolase RhmA
MNNNAVRFRERLRAGQVLLGTCVTFGDIAVTDALCEDADFLWIDMEHSALTLAEVQQHIIATKGTNTTPLIRVPWNDPVLIKPILDMDAAGVIVPMVRTAEEARQAVASCRYPPAGVRGFSPRRPTNYMRVGGPDVCKEIDETVLCIVQIEHIDAVNNLDAILAVPGLDGIAVGPADLAASMGHIGDPAHPEVVAQVKKIFNRARETDVLAGTSVGHDTAYVAQLIGWGAQWVAMGADFTLLVDMIGRLTSDVRKRIA